jgi:hypothetical protein
MPKKRIKSRALTLYVSPKYEDKILFLKYTGGLTRYIEQCLEKVQIDENLMKSIRRVEMAKMIK